MRGGARHQAPADDAEQQLKADVARLQMRKMAKPISGFEQSQLDRLYQELDCYTGLAESERAKSVSAEKEIASLREDIWRRLR
ncbi:hypothetical protein THAOC_31985 [Thalassiosira oceanica]|uniref:Uncharacterized protein n=1 Tax=Thalassiosira oceanica TaxID=159749 RepID=K0RAB2_THAOC|nr:hypothetical protein THAOC_31985 [Thalassiosira oceanica]|eukprot:EJK49169.1 hypothetical protein THAOC_31985 [Thalassiosira oceanica]